MVRAMADAPAMVRHENRRVREVADEVVQRLVVGEALVAAAGH